MFRIDRVVAKSLQYTNVICRSRVPVAKAESIAQHGESSVGCTPTQTPAESVIPRHVDERPKSDVHLFDVPSIDLAVLRLQLSQPQRTGTSDHVHCQVFSTFRTTHQFVDTQKSHHHGVALDALRQEQSKFRVGKWCCLWVPTEANVLFVITLRCCWRRCKLHQRLWSST